MTILLENPFDDPEIEQENPRRRRRSGGRRRRRSKARSNPKRRRRSRRRRSAKRNPGNPGNPRRSRRRSSRRRGARRNPSLLTKGGIAKALGNAVTIGSSVWIGDFLTGLVGRYSPVAIPGGFAGTKLVVGLAGGMLLRALPLKFLRDLAPTFGSVNVGLAAYQLAIEKGNLPSGVDMAFRLSTGIKSLPLFGRPGGSTSPVPSGMQDWITAGQLGQAPQLYDYAYEGGY